MEVDLVVALTAAALGAGASALAAAGQLLLGRRRALRSGGRKSVDQIEDDLEVTLEDLRASQDELRVLLRQTQSKLEQLRVAAEEHGNASGQASKG